MSIRAVVLLTLPMAVLACGGDDGGSAAADATAADPDGNNAEPCDFSQPGTICTIAGNGSFGYDGDEPIVALAARMSLPQDTVANANGEVYVLDWNNHRIRKITPDGMLLHVSGRGELGGGLEDPANADFNHPTNMLLSTDEKELYVAAWHNSKIRKVDLESLEISEVGGDGRRAYFGDGGPALTSALDLPTAIAWNPEGELVILDQANQVIRKIDSEGIIHHIAGRCVADRVVACMPEQEPTLCPGGSGKYVCGDPATECAGPCNPGFAESDNVLLFRMSQPFGQSADPGGRMVYDTEGNLYFADAGNNLIRKITPEGAMEIVAGTKPVAGVPQEGASPDGTMATSALLNRPTDLALSATGELYFTDVENHCVRKVASDGMLYTVAGECGTKGFGGDGGNPTSALLKLPYGLDISGEYLYISDTGNQRIRVLHL